MAERQVVFYECQDVDKRPPFDRLKAVGGINNLDDEDWRVPDGDFDLGVIVDRTGSSTEPTRLRLLRIRPDAPYMLSATRQLTQVEVADDETSRSSRRSYCGRTTSWRRSARVTHRGIRDYRSTST